MTRNRVVLGELEVAVLDVLWQLGDATVADVVDALPDDRARHYNTVATVLARLEKRGVVAKDRDGRVLTYRPVVTRDELGREYLALLRRDLFGGSVRRMVSALLGHGKPTADELTELRRMITELEDDDAD